MAVSTSVAFRLTRRRDCVAGRDASTSSCLGQGAGDPVEDREQAVLPRVRVVLVQKLTERLVQDVTENLQQANAHSASCETRPNLLPAKSTRGVRETWASCYKFQLK